MQGCHQFRGHPCGIDVFFLEEDCRAAGSELSNGLQILRRVAGEAGDGLDQNAVNESAAAVVQHPFEILPFLHRGAGDALVGVDVHQPPVLMFHDVLCIVDVLRCEGIELILRGGADPAVSCHPQLLCIPLMGGLDPNDPSFFAVQGKVSNNLLFFRGCSPPPCIVGRVCNRIGGAYFSLGESKYFLAKNDGENHLHGGVRGFDKYNWVAEPLINGVRLKRLSPSGEEGYPGTLLASVCYRLEECSLVIEYEASTDHDTLCSLTNHSYFNLNGGDTALEHTLVLASDSYLETSSNCLPTGRILPVSGTAFDFRTAKAIGRDIDSPAEQLRLVNGYDHHFCLAEDNKLHRAAILRGNRTGITMIMETTSPGVQLYTANWLSLRNGKYGALYYPRDAVCLEPQFPPDAIHRPHLAQPLLRKDSSYHHCSVYTFS